MTRISGSMPILDTASFFQRLEHIAQRCTGCKACQVNCVFLQKHGCPGLIAQRHNSSNSLGQTISFECSLCRLCTAVCPEGLDPGAMFLEMRRAATAGGEHKLARYSRVLAYENRGISPLYTHYAIPQGCDTIFFPGCALPGASPGSTLMIYRQLRQAVANLGIVLDCCTKISHDLGRQDIFVKSFHWLTSMLVSLGIRRILVACPSCHQIFHDYGNDFSVSTVYELLCETTQPCRRIIGQHIAIHDACMTRFFPDVHASVRELAGRSGVSIDRLPNEKTKTFCCGEGGAVSCVSPQIARHWANLRGKQQGATRHLVAYCSGCTAFLSSVAKTSHLLDLVLRPEAVFSGQCKPARPPITYLNRLMFKRKLVSEITSVATIKRPAVKRAGSGFDSSRFLLPF